MNSCWMRTTGGVTRPLVTCRLDPFGTRPAEMLRLLGARASQHPAGYIGLIQMYILSDRYKRTYPQSVGTLDTLRLSHVSYCKIYGFNPIY